MATWEQERREELVDLAKMLRMLESVNNGSNALGKIDECIGVAERLLTTDMVNLRRSFIEYLYNLSIGDE